MVAGLQTPQRLGAGDSGLTQMDVEDELFAGLVAWLSGEEIGSQLWISHDPQGQGAAHVKGCVATLLRPGGRRSAQGPSREA